MGRPRVVVQTGVEGGNTVTPKRVEFSYNDDSYLAAIDRYLYEIEAGETVLTPVARSAYSYTDGDLTELVHTDPKATTGGPLRRYGWTVVEGRITAESNDDDTADDVAYTYTDGELTSVDDLDGTDDFSYSYDDTGNRVEVQDPSGTHTYQTDPENDPLPFNRLRTDGTYHYDYDAEGNRVDRYVWADADSDDEVDWNANEISNWTEYTWDHRNRLIRVESGAAYGTTDVTVTFGYDYLNRWISTNVDYASADDTSEYFVYGGATLPDEVAPWDRAATNLRNIGQITLRLEGNRDFVGGKETADIANRYLWGVAVDQVLADEQIEWNTGADDYDIEQILWPLADHQGTIRDLAKVNVTTGATDVVNNRTYDACAFLINETDTGVHHLFGFTARHWDPATGLQNNPVLSATVQDPPRAVWYHSLSVRKSTAFRKRADR